MNEVILFSVLAFVIGVIFGSFLNALIYRFKNNISIISKRSFCPSCKEKLKWLHNIPLFSYLFLRGRCSFCDTRISIQYLLVELWLGLAFLFVVLFGGYDAFTLELIRDWFILFVLTFIFIYDLRYRLILDKVAVPAILILLVSSWYLGWHSWQSLGLGILVGGGFFLLQFIISHGRWIGGGDIRLGVLMGVILGWPDVLLGLFIAYILGAIVSIGLIIFKDKKLASKTPFGTYLVVGTLASMFFSEEIIEWYLSLILF